MGVLLVEFGGTAVSPLGGSNYRVADYSVAGLYHSRLSFSPYNTILGRPILGIVKAITSTHHLMMKFSISTGIGEVKGDQKIARQCFITAMKTESPLRTNCNYR